VQERGAEKMSMILKLILFLRCLVNLCLFYLQNPERSRIWKFISIMCSSFELLRKGKVLVGWLAYLIKDPLVLVFILYLFLQRKFSRFCCFKYGGNLNFSVEVFHANHFWFIKLNLRSRIFLVSLNFYRIPSQFDLIIVNKGIKRYLSRILTAL